MCYEGNGPCSVCAKRVEDVPIKNPQYLFNEETVWEIDGEMGCPHCGSKLLMFREAAILDLSPEEVNVDVLQIL